MKHLFLTLLLATLCAATSYGQTIKSLGFNSTNGQVVANTGTNTLTFTNFVTANGGLMVSGVGLESEGLLISGENSIAWEEESAKSATRTNLGLGLPALTNTSNVTTMRALSGSTNTNHPFSGSVSVVGTNNTNTLVFSNGILQAVQ